jgi:hypothetical protein
MSNEKMREEFEVWAVSQAASMKYSFPEDATQINGLGDYAIVWVQGAWLGWQASRAALCIELPSLTSEHDREDVHYNMAVSNCREAIESTGVRTK